MSALNAGANHVPITLRRLAVRGLAADSLARGGSFERDGRCVRERAVNWLALAMLLGAWNVEARLDDTSRPATLEDQPREAAGVPIGGFDWTEPERTRWTSRAVQATNRRGA